MRNQKTGYQKQGNHAWLGMARNLAHGCPNKHVCGKTSFTIAEEIRKTFNLILNDMSAIHVDLLIFFVSDTKRAWFSQNLVDVTSFF